MKKELWIIGILIVGIIVLLMIIISNKSVIIDINTINKSLNTPINNSAVNSSKTSSNLTLENNCGALLNQIREELANAQKCSFDSECIINEIQIPCTIYACGSAINKNFDKTKLESLSKEYQSNHCQQGCPGGACSMEGFDVKCVNNGCKIVYAQTNNTNIIQTCTNDFQCSIGQKCWAHCNGALHCATPAEITNAAACLPNE